MKLCSGLNFSSKVAQHTPKKLASVRREANELISIFVASLRTAKGLKSAI